MHHKFNIITNSTVPSGFFTVSEAHFFWNVIKNETLQYVAFSDWLLSRGQCARETIHILMWLEAHFFLSLNIAPLHGLTSWCLSIDPFKDTLHLRFSADRGQTFTCRVCVNITFRIRWGKTCGWDCSVVLETLCSFVGSCRTVCHS